MKKVGEALAAEADVALTPRHWKWSNICKKKNRTKWHWASAISGPERCVDIKEFYQLFPVAPLKTATKIAGIPKPARLYLTLKFSVMSTNGKINKMMIILSKGTLENVYAAFAGQWRHAWKALKRNIFFFTLRPSRTQEKLEHLHVATVGNPSMYIYPPWSVVCPEWKRWPPAWWKWKNWYAQCPLSSGYSFLHPG